jgi:putative flippase GtrA
MLRQPNVEYGIYENMSIKHSNKVDTLFMWVDRISRRLFHFLCHIIRKAPVQTTEDAIVQFVKFGIVGVTNTAVSYVTYAFSLIVLRQFGLNEDYLIAQALSFILGVVWSFYWNNIYVFDIRDGQKRSLWKSLVKTFISYSFTGLFLSSVLLVLWIKIFRISEFIAPIINLIVTVPLNFIMNKFWAFRSKRENS